MKKGLIYAVLVTLSLSAAIVAPASPVPVSAAETVQTGFYDIVAKRFTNIKDFKTLSIKEKQDLFKNKNVFLVSGSGVISAIDVLITSNANLPAKLSPIDTFQNKYSVNFIEIANLSTEVTEVNITNNGDGTITFSGKANNAKTVYFFSIVDSTETLLGSVDVDHKGNYSFATKEPKFGILHYYVFAKDVNGRGSEAVYGSFEVLDPTTYYKQIILGTWNTNFNYNNADYAINVTFKEDWTSDLVMAGLFDSNSPYAINGSNMTFNINVGGLEWKVVGEITKVSDNEFTITTPSGSKMRFIR